MKEPSPRQATQLLVAWDNGNQHALQELMPLVYRELQPAPTWPPSVGNGHRTVPYRDYQTNVNECGVRNEERCGERSLQQSDDFFAVPGRDRCHYNL